MLNYASPVCCKNVHFKLEADLLQVPILESQKLIEVLNTRQGDPFGSKMRRGERDLTNKSVLKIDHC